MGSLSDSPLGAWMSSIVQKEGGPSKAQAYAQQLADGSISYDEVKKFADLIGEMDGPKKDGGYATPGANFLDDVAAETVKLGVYNSDINRLYRDASINYNTDSSSFKPIDESQRMYSANATGSNARQSQAANAGSGVPKASVTAASSSATKKQTLMGS
jgi:hypothetical protein